MKQFTHLGSAGNVTMVDVSKKPATSRKACATGFVRMPKTVVKKLKQKAIPKGDVLTLAQIAGIVGAKRTAELIPLCHPIGLDHVEVTFKVLADGVRVTATTRTRYATGVEMEAMTAVSVASLAIYDMVKSVTRDVTITEIELLEKSGGRSGHWRKR